MVNSLPGSVHLKLVIGKYSWEAGANDFMFNTPFLNWYSFSAYFGISGLKDSAIRMIFWPFFFINHKVSPRLEPFTQVPYNLASSVVCSFLQPNEKARIVIINPKTIDLIYFFAMTTKKKDSLPKIEIFCASYDQGTESAIFHWDNENLFASKTLMYIGNYFFRYLFGTFEDE